MRVKWSGYSIATKKENSLRIPYYYKGVLYSAYLPLQEDKFIPGLKFSGINSGVNGDISVDLKIQPGVPLLVDAQNMGYEAIVVSSETFTQRYDSAPGFGPSTKEVEVEEN